MQILQPHQQCISRITTKMYRPIVQVQPANISLQKILQAALFRQTRVLHYYEDPSDCHPSLSGSFLQYNTINATKNSMVQSPN